MEIENRMASAEMHAGGSKLYEGLNQKLDLQAEQFGGRRWVLLTDIDDTIFSWGSGGARTPVELVERMESMSVPIIFNTGRNIRGVVDLINSRRIPVPDAVSTCLCGPLYILDPSSEIDKTDNISEDNFIEDEHYNKNLSSSIDAPKERAKILERIEEVREDADFSEIHISNPVASSPHTVELVYRSERALDMDVAIDFRRKMSEVCPHLACIYYQDWKDTSGLTWSVTFAPWGKDRVVQYLEDQLHVNGGVIAGDAGNDLQALLSDNIRSDFLRVFVGRKKPDPDIVSAIASLGLEVSGRRALYKQNSEGRDKYYYIEPAESERFGPLSVQRAVRMAGQIWSISRNK